MSNSRHVHKPHNGRPPQGDIPPSATGWPSIATVLLSLTIALLGLPIRALAQDDVASPENIVVENAPDDAIVVEEESAVDGVDLDEEVDTTQTEVSDEEPDEDGEPSAEPGSLLGQSNLGIPAEGADIALRAQSDYLGFTYNSNTGFYRVTVDNRVNYDEGYRMLGLINARRNSAGKASLRWDNGLENYAILRATELSLKYSSIRPNGKPFNDGAAGYNGERRWQTSATSNIASAFCSTLASNSSDYNEIISSNYTRVAGAVVKVGTINYCVLLLSSGTVANGNREGTGTDIAYWPDWLESTQANLRYRAQPSSVTLQVGQTKTLKVYTGESLSVPTRANDLAWWSLNRGESESNLKASVIPITGNSSDLIIAGVKKGTATVHGAYLSQSGTWVDGCTVNVTVQPANIADCTLHLSGSSFTYTGSPIIPIYMVWTNFSRTFNEYGYQFMDNRRNSNELIEDSDYTITWSNNTNAGTAIATATGKGDFTGSKQVEFTIAPAPLSSTTLTTISDQTYTGSMIKPKPRLTFNNKTLVEGTDYTLSYSNNTLPGIATVTVTGKGNFSGTRTLQFAIYAPISAATIDAIGQQSHTGNALTPKPKLTLGGKTLIEGNDYTLSYRDNTGIGTATITITGKGHLTGSTSTAFNIIKAYVKPSWSGASKMPVGSKATYSVTNGTIKVKSGSAIKVSGNVVYATKAGTAQLALIDSRGNEYATKTITVFTMASKSYELQSAVDSKYVLDIQGKSTKNSARMITYQRNNGKNQRYQFVAKRTASSLTYYAIKCMHSGKYVDVQGGGTKQSQPVIQYSYNGKDNQLWYLTVDPSNRVTFMSVKSGMSFDVKGGKTKNSAPMIQYPFKDSSNQKWILNQK